MTLAEVHEKLRKKTKIKRESRLFMRENLVSDEELNSIIEQNKGNKDGLKFYIEEILENGTWPRDSKL
jgi:hypothetical protein